MPYDASLDEQIFSKSLETDMGRLTVSIYSYNNGPKKIQISRENRNKEGNLKFAKMGRLSKEEATSIIPIMQEALTELQ